MKPLFVTTLAAALSAGPLLWAQTPGRPVRVTIQEEKQQLSEPAGLVDPQQHIQYQYGPTMSFGFVVDGQRITYSPNGSTNHSLVRIDGRDYFFGNPPGRWEEQRVELKNSRSGKKRLGTKSTWVINNIAFTQILEIVPSKLPPKARPGQKRRLDTCLVRYVITNRDSKPHSVGIRSMLDMLIVNNDGALFASPTTHPGKILDGVELRGKAIPAYLQVLQNPNLQNPGFVAHFTFRLGKSLIGPDRIVMTGLAAGGGWDVNAQRAGFDSAIAVYFSPRTIKPKGKFEGAYAYGQGIASNPEDEGKVALALGGSFVPGKVFTVMAYVDEPLASQSLRLEVPKGMTLLEGPATQPVPLPLGDEGRAVVVWKGRVQTMGRFALRLHSSNGVSYSRTITVSPELSPQTQSSPRKE
jgi:hypothetical protein